MNTNSLSSKNSFYRVPVKVELFEKLKKICKDNDTTVTEVLEQALSECVKKPYYLEKTAMDFHSEYFVSVNTNPQLIELINDVVHRYRLDKMVAIKFIVEDALLSCLDSIEYLNSTDDLDLSKVISKNMLQVSEGVYIPKNNIVAIHRMRRCSYFSIEVHHGAMGSYVTTTSDYDTEEMSLKAYKSLVSEMGECSQDYISFLNLLFLKRESVLVFGHEKNDRNVIITYSTGKSNSQLFKSFDNDVDYRKAVHSFLMKY